MRRKVLIWRRARLFATRFDRLDATTSWENEQRFIEAMTADFGHHEHQSLFTDIAHQ